MKKYIVFIFLCCALRAFTQLTPGSLAADFTVQDVAGNSRNLYSQLDSGKTVILHCFATWDSFAWEYYQQNVLDAFNSLYGTGGNGTVTIWRVECETTNTSAQLQGPASLTGDVATDTQGDWLAESELPIIDDSTLAAQLNLEFLPVVVLICPDRIVRFADQMSIGNLANLVFQNSCPPISEGFDPALISATSSRSCGSNDIDLQVVLKNLGTDTLFNVTIQLGGSTPAQSVGWEGQLSSYQSDTISIEGLDIISDGFVELSIEEVNADAANDSLQLRTNVGYCGQLVRLELALDAYPDEVSWEIRNENDSVLYNGGGYEVDYQYINNVFQLPSAGCYNFFLNDTRGDGLHGSQYGGFDGFCKLYSMVDSSTVEEEMFHYDGSYNFSPIQNTPSFLQYSFEAGSPISVSEIQKDWIAYPVPANQKLYLRSSSGIRNAEIVLTDMAGRTMHPLVSVIDNDKLELDIATLYAGLYILSIRTNLHTENFSIIVHH
jgi:hypothetical protein